MNWLVNCHRQEYTFGGLALKASKFALKISPIFGRLSAAVFWRRGHLQAICQKYAALSLPRLSSHMEKEMVPTTFKFTTEEGRLGAPQKRGNKAR